MNANDKQLLDAIVLDYNRRISENPVLKEYLFSLYHHFLALMDGVWLEPRPPILKIVYDDNTKKDILLHDAFKYEVRDNAKLPGVNPG